MLKYVYLIIIKKYNMDSFSFDTFKNLIKKEIDVTKEHLCYGVDSMDKLMYARGRLSALETLLQDIKNLQKENNDGDTD